MTTTDRYCHVRHLGLSLLALLTVSALAPFVHATKSHAQSGVWTRTGSLHQPRGFDAAVSLPGGQVLVAGGCKAPCGDDSEPSLASAELYTPQTGTWTVTGPMHQPRLQYTLTLLPDGQVLAAGGCATAGCTSIIGSAEVYNPQTGTWTVTGALHHARALHTATSLPDGRVLVAGGCGVKHCSPVLASAEIYDPATGTWTAAASLHGPRARHRATLLPSGQVLVAGGCAVANCSTVLASAESIRRRPAPGAGPDPLYQARASLALTLLHSGKVLVTGGFGPNGLLASTELYDPLTGTWTTAGTMSLLSARDFETPTTATLLPSGQVLVAGDGGGGKGCLASAELYNPSSRTWALIGPLNVPRSFQTTTLLSSGQVLVAGGLNATGGILAGSEIYHP